MRVRSPVNSLYKRATAVLIYFRIKTRIVGKGEQVFCCKIGLELGYPQFYHHLASDIIGKSKRFQAQVTAILNKSRGSHQVILGRCRPGHISYLARSTPAVEY